MLGVKGYLSNNTTEQGPGSDGSDADFNFQYDDNPAYPNQSRYKYPNRNVAVFSESVIYLTDRFSITPGLRFEFISTESDGFFRRINTDAAGNVILNEQVDENALRERSFLLAGLGSSFKVKEDVELYLNATQNYRSVTFTDISIVNPAFVIAPDIGDERGYTIDLGVRGKWKSYLRFDTNVFAIGYNDRIGFTQQAQDDGSVKTVRDNVGDAFIYGLELGEQWNIDRTLGMSTDYIFNHFVNLAVIDSEYVRSEENGVEGNSVEFIPQINLKTGVRFGYKDYLMNVQYTYLAEQFTDATNAIDGNLSGVIGIIPAYNILDISASYRYKFAKLEIGVNNVLNEFYFTRRATGYPGPGIIPSPDRNVYATLEMRF